MSLEKNERQHMTNWIGQNKIENQEYKKKEKFKPPPFKKKVTPMSK